MTTFFPSGYLFGSIGVSDPGVVFFALWGTFGAVPTLNGDVWQVTLPPLQPGRATSVFYRISYPAQEKSDGLVYHWTNELVQTPGEIS